MVVAPDSGLVLFHGLSGKDIDLKEYLEAGYRSELNGPPQIGPAAAQKDWLLDLANRRYTSMVDLQAILSLKDRARTLGSEVSVRYARDLRPNDFKTGTVILLGMSSANPWVELFERDMNFVLKDDYTKFVWVINRSPQKGEPARWETVRTDPERRVFAVVAYLPNLARDGNALIIEGISMAGTEAAMDFVDDDAKLLPFLNRIRLPDGTLPHFELLLETHNMGASAVRSQILAWRTMRLIVRRDFPSADKVGEYTVFNIKGNEYRLISLIFYRSKKLFIRDVITHAEYDKGRWKNDYIDRKPYLRQTTGESAP